jgi:hypothetical protein
VTIVDTADLADRTCSRCGAVYTDALMHRRWHRELDELIDELTRAADQTTDGMGTVHRLLAVVCEHVGLGSQEDAAP